MPYNYAPSQGDLYVGAATCDPNDRGIYKIRPSSGDVTKIASLPPDALPNGIALYGGSVYVADSGAPRIWRASPTGTGEPAQAWVDGEPLLVDPVPTDAAPGANGLQFFGHVMYVANAGAGTIVSIPMEPADDDVTPGTAAVVYGPPGSDAQFVQDPAVFPGCDDFAFDFAGRIWCATDPFQTLVLLSPWTGDATVVLTADDGLDGPTAVAFGRNSEATKITISNAQFPFFPPTGNGPSLMQLQVFVPGYPFR